MPAGRPENSAGASGNSGGQRTNFRPPWVKESPPAIPMPSAPWTLANRSKEMAQQKPETDPKGPPRKTSTVKIVPMQPAENGTVRDPHTFQVPKLKEIPKTESKLQSREIKVPITVTSRQKETPMQVHIDTTKRLSRDLDERELPILREVKKPPTDNREARKQEVKEVPVLKEVKREVKEVPVLKEVKREVKEIPEVKIVSKEPEIDKAIPAERNAMVRQESLKKMSAQMGPPPPPMPPAPPPPPALPKELDTVKLTPQQLEKIEQLRARPRRRPDWGAMMKDIESGRKLRKVECNDRSQPILPQNNVKGQFVYESEKTNLHNQFLRQIQTGTSLKHVKTNDRSKPILEGLRKFRRQMTIEEQIQKSQSIANMAEPEVEEEVDEMDDIDKIRDDLQSTKQMLALELRNKEAQIRENKRLQARLLNMEIELEKERAAARAQANNTKSNDDTADEKAIQNLKEEIGRTKKNAEEMEKKYHETTDHLEAVKFDLEEVKRQNQLLLKKLQTQSQDGPQKRQSIIERRDSAPAPKEKEESETEEETESESSSDEEDAETKAQKRLERELRLLGNKLRSYKNKEEAARRERKSLREQMKKNHHAIKQEKKKYRALQREVNKMAALMRDDEEEADDEEKEDKEETVEEEESEEESETESESETSEEEEDSASEDENMPIEMKKDRLQDRAKRHENCLNALKKGNYMLKANVDRLQDDLNKQKEEVLTLQEDLDSVLADLG